MKQGAHAGEVFWGVHPAWRRLVNHANGDGVAVPQYAQLFQRFDGRCKLAFGIGTNLTNDLGSPPDHVPLQIVIKMTRCNGQPVAKLSDAPGKNMCNDEKYLAYLRQVFEIPATQG